MITKELFPNKHCCCDVTVYTLTNKSGANIKILTMGGILQQINMPDRDGNLADVICGFDSVDDYLNGGGYQGALIGRYGNRIGKGEFTLNGVKYQLAKNNGENHLHGGDSGFNRKNWDAVPYEEARESGLILTMISPDGDENYPGKLDVKVTYTLTDENELKIHYEAVSDKDTIVNLTNHSYFNLGGFASGDILGHILQINSDAITEINEGLIPTGISYEVKGTAFDFNKPEKIGARINASDIQLKYGGGYDHNYILNNGGKLEKVAELYDPASGRMMEVITDQPGVQIYSSNQMTGDVPFKGGVAQTPRHAVCLETQHAPDSPNHPEFPSTVLKAGEKYDTTTIYSFGVK